MTGEADRIKCNTGVEQKVGACLYRRLCTLWRLTSTPG